MTVDKGLSIEDNALSIEDNALSVADATACSHTSDERGAPSRQVGDRWEGASTARPLEACERLMNGHR